MHLGSLWSILSCSHGTQRRRHLEARYGLALGVRIGPARAQWISLTCHRVVELSVGVMCSSLPAFAGFIRYHLPLFRSMRSRLSSTFRSIHFSKVLNRSSDQGSTEKLASGNAKVTLGSRVDGRGHFMTMTGIFGKEGTEQSTVSQLEDDPLPSCDRTDNATRRHFHEEMVSPQQSLIQYPAPPDSRPSETEMTTALPRKLEQHGQDRDHTIPSASGTYDDDPTQRTWRRLRWRSSARTGYWDLISGFRSRGADSRDETKELQVEHVSP